jgi:hypothetical membrane protein
LPEPVSTGTRAAGPAAARRTLLPHLSARNAGRLGLASIAAILVGEIATAIVYAGPAGEAYSPLNHFISELGQTSQSRLAPVFNAGIVIGGLGMGAFLLALAGHLTGRFRGGLMAAGSIAGISGVLVGFLPMDTHAVHRFVSAVFFCTGWIVVAIFSVWLARHRSGFPRLLLVPGTISVAIFWAFLTVYSTYHPLDQDAPILERPAVWTVPLLEWAALLSLLLWFGCLSLLMLRRGSWPGTEV